jgi:hypothetical protein
MRRVSSATVWIFRSEGCSDSAASAMADSLAGVVRMGCRNDFRQEAKNQSGLHFWDPETYFVL